ncbi:MAG: hypothetical protein L3J28_03990 [Candidatus Polarisedimenticolaceae bacterium]|nr:hypothetical protein [Candidatus Polarisedimenticolaceae bacterium]
MQKILIFVLLGFSAQWWFSDPTISASSSDISFKYIEKYTREHLENESLPMIIALHGDGDSINNFYETALNQLTAPARIIVIASPINSRWPNDSHQFIQYGRALNEVVATLSSQFPTSKKPLLMGFSGGAEMAYYQALKYGDSYSYIFPIAGALSKETLTAEPDRPGAKVYAYHGKSDKNIPFKAGQHASALLQQSGIRVKFNAFEGGHLGLFTSMKSTISQAIDKRVNTLL